MKWFLTLLVAIGVMAGLQGRAFAADPCEVFSEMCQADHSGHHHEDQAPCDSTHDEKCPSEHHHQCGTCCHVLPLVSENDFACRLPLPASYRLLLRPECDLIPEGPYLSSDRPPII